MEFMGHENLFPEHLLPNAFAVTSMMNSYFLEHFSNISQQILMVCYSYKR